MAEAAEELEQEESTGEEISQEDSILDMSDEDFEKALMGDFAEKDPDTEIETTEESDDEEASQEASEEEDTEEETTEETENEDDDSGDDDALSEEEEGNETEEEEVDEDEELTAEQIRDQIFSPFKANGREMKAESVEDVRQLMQMGANYNKKMAALKPNLKMMKMLQNNDLLDEDKLSFLIDLSKGNSEAIRKLIADSNIEMDDLDKDDKIDYKKGTYTVDDKEVELDETLSDIKDTESYAKTLDVISNKWDEASRELLVKNPAAIRVLNDHIAQGIYDKITAAVETERMFNRIPASMSDLEAYKLVGDQINERGGFAPAPKSGTKRIAGKPKKAVDTKRAERKKAASSTKSAPKSKAKEDFNPLAMSDEEFEKLGMADFI